MPLSWLSHGQIQTTSTKTDSATDNSVVIALIDAATSAIHYCRCPGSDGSGGIRTYLAMHIRILISLVLLGVAERSHRLSPATSYGRGDMALPETPDPYHRRSYRAHVESAVVVFWHGMINEAISAPVSVLQWLLVGLSSSETFRMRACRA